MKTRAGFTLIELLVVIAIIGILSAIGFINLPRDKFQVREASRVISADILRARSEAIRLNTWVGMTFDLTTSSYAIFQDEDKDWAADDGVFILQRRLSSEFPLVAITAAGFQLGASRVRFDVRGLPNWNGTVKLESRGQSSYTLDVVMALQGRVKVAAP